MAPSTVTNIRTASSATKVRTRGRLLLAIVAPSLLAAALVCSPAAAAVHGPLDRSFAESGVLRTASSHLSLGFEHDQVAEDPRGRLLVTGAAPEAITVARYFKGGRLDRSFGHDGVATVASEPLVGYGSGEPDPMALALTPGGSVLIAASLDTDVGSSGGEVGILARLKPNGALDRGFAGTPSSGDVPGVAIFRDRSIHAIALQGRRILIAGEAGRGDAQIRRLTSNGTIDPGFGTESEGVELPPPPQAGRHPVGGAINALQVLPDHSIYAAGYDLGRLLVAHLRADGRLDKRFGDDGVVRLAASRQRGCGCTYGSDLARDRHGRLVISGFVSSRSALRSRPSAAARRYVAEPSHMVLVRLQPSGALDPSFGKRGIVRTAAGGASYGHSALVESDGHIVVVGSSAGSDQRIGDGPARLCVVRYRADGGLDRRFAADGIFTARLAGRETIGWDAIADSRGRILVAGTVSYGSGSLRGGFLARLRAP
jgi:uncharacterized delta-60 repeat protein